MTRAGDETDLVQFHGLENLPLQQLLGLPVGILSSVGVTAKGGCERDAVGVHAPLLLGKVAGGTVYGGGVGHEPVGSRVWKLREGHELVVISWGERLGERTRDVEGGVGSGSVWDSGRSRSNTASSETGKKRSTRTGSRGRRH
jgi:hypothetical protein